MLQPSAAIAAAKARLPAAEAAHAEATRVHRVAERALQRLLPPGTGTTWERTQAHLSALRQRWLAEPARRDELDEAERVMLELELLLSDAAWAVEEVWTD